MPRPRIDRREIVVTIRSELLEVVERAWRTLGYHSRSEMIRDAITEFLEKRGLLDRRRR